MAMASEGDVWDQDPPGSERAGTTFVTRTPGLNKVVKAKVVREDWDDDDDDEEEERVEGGMQRDANGNMKTTATASGPRKDGTGTVPGPSAPGRREPEAKEPRSEEDSSTIWEEANKRAPMPELIVARASTSQCSPPPPPAALQPTLRILKRPSPNTGANNAGVGSSISASHSSSSPGPTSGSGSASGGASPVPRGTLAEREAQYQEARNRIFGEKEKLGWTSAAGVVVLRDPLGPVSEPEVEPGMSTGGQDKVHGADRPAKGFGERRKGKK